MKTEIKFDTDGSMQVIELEEPVTVDGKDFVGVTTRTIQASQIEKHLPMVELNASQKTKAAKLITDYKAAEAEKLD